MPGAQIRLLDTRVLDRPMPTANAEALAHAVASCERQLALLGLDGTSLLERTKAALQLGRDGYASARQVARQLNTTPRTLRRRLLEHGSSYTKLLEAARQRDSRVLLDNPALQIRQISQLLGFDNPANFSRAFKRWSGMAPQAYRLGTRA
jgi:AraC-like DNA-binding protein